MMEYVFSRLIVEIRIMTELVTIVVAGVLYFEVVSLGPAPETSFDLVDGLVMMRTKRVFSISICLIVFLHHVGRMLSS